MNEENKKPKIVGWRKMGIGIGAITALSLNPTIDFKIAAIIGTIAIIGIITQGILDYRKNIQHKGETK
jgi:multidrug efflux pump subunit AcrB